MSLFYSMTGIKKCRKYAVFRHLDIQFFGNGKPPFMMSGLPLADRYRCQTWISQIPSRWGFWPLICLSASGNAPITINNVFYSAKYSKQQSLKEKNKYCIELKYIQSLSPCMSLLSSHKIFFSKINSRHGYFYFVKFPMSTVLYLSAKHYGLIA